jgi:hypothetical protein
LGKAQILNFASFELIFGALFVAKIDAESGARIGPNEVALRRGSRKWNVDSPSEVLCHRDLITIAKRRFFFAGECVMRAFLFFFFFFFFFVFHFFHSKWVQALLQITTRNLSIKMLHFLKCLSMCRHRIAICIQMSDHLWSRRRRRLRLQWHRRRRVVDR